MIVFFKNYKRTDRTLLSIQSVRYLFPNVDIRCLNLYDNSADEYLYDYEKQIEIFQQCSVKLYFDKKKWNFGSESAYGSANNGYYFTEAINKVQALTKDIDDTILFLDEDNFFTTGQTLQFLLDNPHDLAWCYWGPPDPLVYPNRHKVGINGSFLSFNSKKLNHMFPIVEMHEYIENILGYEFYDKCESEGHQILQIPTRMHYNYFGDGVCTNDINIIMDELNKANIPYIL
jgi:hypothetical protein